MATCSRGWTRRCPDSHGAKCKCRCGGVNHGRAIAKDADAGTLHARWELVSSDNEQVTIRDVGGSIGRTVTNDVEYVVRSLGFALRGRRLFYYDSEEQLDEILVKDEAFAGFAPGVFVAGDMPEGR